MEDRIWVIAYQNSSIRKIPKCNWYIKKCRLQENPKNKMISKTKKQGPSKIMKKYQNISKISKKEVQRKFCPNDKQ